MRVASSPATIPELVTDSKERQQAPGGLGMVLSLGLQLAVSFLLPIAGGIWLDGRWGSSPMCLLLGMLLGAGLAGVALRDLIRNTEK